MSSPGFLFPDLGEFRSSVRHFISNTITPRLADWSDRGIVDRDFYLDAAGSGLLGLGVPPEYGGPGGDFRHNVILDEELCWAGAPSMVISLGGLNDLLVPYLLELCTPEQKRRWLPGLCSGHLISALAMTERAAGSDLRGIRTTALRDGDDFIVNGSKIFIGNGINADLVVVVARTSGDDEPTALTLLVAERGMTGFSRRDRLDKLGLAAQDTAELHFDGMRVPASNQLGSVGEGMTYLRTHLPRERLTAALIAVASMERTLQHTFTHLRERTAFGGPLTKLQAIRFEMAELATEVRIARVLVNDDIGRLLDGQLTETDAAMTKWWTTELQQKVVSRSLQLYGGQGYLRSNPAAQDLLNSRQSTIYAGTTQIMKEIIGRHYARSHPAWTPS